MNDEVFNNRAERVFQLIVVGYDTAPVWTGSYTEGLYNAYLIMTGQDEDARKVIDRLHAAVDERKAQRERNNG